MSPVREAGAVRLRAAVPSDGAAVAHAFGAARAAMRYLPRLHSAAEDVAFFSGQVLPTSTVTLAESGHESGHETDPETDPETGHASGHASGHGHEIVGFSAVKDGWLDHLYVVPLWQGVGIGATLLDRAKTENPAGLDLWVFAANHRAISFYARAGFVEVRRTDGSANEERLPDVQMRWAHSS